MEIEELKKVRKEISDEINSNLTTRSDDPLYHTLLNIAGRLDVILQKQERELKKQKKEER